MNSLRPLGALAATSLLALAAAPSALAQERRVSIDAPQEGATVAGEIQLNASAPGASRVSFFIDGSRRRTDRDAPFSHTIQTTELAPGGHVVKVRAAFEGRPRATSYGTFVVDNPPLPDPLAALGGTEPLPTLAAPGSSGGDAPPTVSFRSPERRERVSGTITWRECQVDADDDKKVSRVEFSVDGQPLGVQRYSPYNCDFDSTKVGNGSHTLRAVAYDEAGNRAVARRKVKVRNRRRPPSQTIADAPQPAPPTQAPPSGSCSGTGTALFTGDLETGNTSQWDEAQQEGGASVSVVTSPLAQGGYAAKFTLPSSGGRAELFKSGAAGSVGEGDERIYSWSTMPMADAIGPTGAFQNILQWKDQSGGPPIAFELGGNQYAIKAGGAFKFAGPANPGQWTRFEVRIKFSTSASTGSIEVKRNGAVVVPRYSVATLGDGRSYLKQGYYAGNSSGGGTVYHDGMVVSAP